MSIGEFTSNVTVKDLLDAGLHFGHQTKRWNPKMKRYIFGARNGIYIIDLDKAMPLIQQAQKFAYDTVVRGRTVLFVGTKKQAQEPVKQVAEKAKQPYVINRWLGGTLTNLVTIRKSVARLREIEKMEKDGAFDKMPKKEVARLRHELEKLQFNLCGVTDMEQLPGAMFVIDTNREANAVREAVRLKIPVLAVVDTNCDPDPINYPVPGNDDAIKAIQLIVTLIGEAVEKGVSEYAKVAAEETRRRAAEEVAVQARARAEAAAKATAATAAAAAAEQEQKAEKKAKRTKAEGKEKVAKGEDKPADAAAEPASPA